MHKPTLPSFINKLTFHSPLPDSSERPDLKHHHNIFQVGLCYGSGHVVTAQHFILINIFFHHLLASDSLHAVCSYSCGI